MFRFLKIQNTRFRYLPLNKVVLLCLNRLQASHISPVYSLIVPLTVLLCTVKVFEGRQFKVISDLLR